MMTDFETLVPGLLVSLKTTIAGNIQYRTKDLLPTETAPDTGAVTQWETTRVIADVAEHEAAKKVRSQARSLITGVCVSSAFGLLCPESKSRQLNEAVIESRRLAAEFNTTSRITKVGVYVITGKVASDDEQAIRAINSEMAELIEAMRDGAANLDPAAIREAANKARDVSMMLSPGVQERVGAAIDLARKEARRLVKAGDVAAIAVDQSVIAALAHSRTAFLEVDSVQSDIAAPVQDAVAVDFAPTADGAVVYEGGYAGDATPERIAEVIAAPTGTPAIETDNLDESTFGELFGDDDSDEPEAD